MGSFGIDTGCSAKTFTRYCHGASSTCKADEPLNTNYTSTFNTNVNPFNSIECRLSRIPHSNIVGCLVFSTRGLCCKCMDCASRASPVHSFSCRTVCGHCQVSTHPNYKPIARANDSIMLRTVNDLSKRLEGELDRNDGDEPPCLALNDPALAEALVQLWKSVFEI